MVVKEESHSRKNWGEIAHVREVPREVKAMSQMNKAGCYAIPRLFNYKRYPTFRKHRIYMEFCPFKDLSVLCERYRAFRSVVTDINILRLH